MHLLLTTAEAFAKVKCKSDEEARCDTAGSVAGRNALSDRLLVFCRT